MQVLSTSCLFASTIEGRVELYGSLLCGSSVKSSGSSTWPPSGATCEAGMASSSSPEKTFAGASTFHGSDSPKILGAQNRNDRHFPLNHWTSFCDFICLSCISSCSFYVEVSVQSRPLVTSWGQPCHRSRRVRGLFPASQGYTTGS